MLYCLLLLTLTQVKAIDQDTIGCGKIGQACCTQDDIDAALETDPDVAEGPYSPYSYEYYLEDGPFCFDRSKNICYNDECVTKKDLPCGQIGEECCNNDDFSYLPFNDCISSSLFCSEGICVTRGQLPCGGENEPCCDKAYQSDSDYFDDCFDGLYCIEGTCQGQNILPCGQEGEQCCKPEDFPGDYYYGQQYYYNYDDNFCFSPAVCMGDKCATCNKPGDPCCFDNQSGKSTCEGANICVDGKCEGCGQVGMACCPDVVPYDYSENSPCFDGLDCLMGQCQYCGYQNSACCGFGDNAYCKLNDLACNGATEKCELCGNMGEACCGKGRCNQDFLQCVAGTCTCGGKGQKCCAGMCEGKLKCRKKSGRCK